MFRHMALALLAVFLCYPSISSAAPSFPSKLREIRDPSGHYAVTWKRGGTTEAKPHRLFLKDLPTGHVTKILEFYRQIDVLWAPGGRFVAVTDWTGSNISQVLLFQPGRKKVINLADSLDHLPEEQPGISDSVHVYFEAISWNGPRKLLFRVFGDTFDSAAPGLRPFEHYFEFDTSGVVTEIKRD